MKINRIRRCVIVWLFVCAVGFCVCFGLEYFRFGFWFGVCKFNFVFRCGCLNLKVGGLGFGFVCVNLSLGLGAVVES